MVTTNVLEFKYPVFAANQVLTKDHLNDLRAFLITADKATNAEAIGTGILGGLEFQVSLAGAVLSSIRLGCGTAITSSGLLATVEGDGPDGHCNLVFAREYKDPAPRDDDDPPGYPPFWTDEEDVSDRTQKPSLGLKVLLTQEEGEADDQAVPINSLGLVPDEWVLMLYVERKHEHQYGCSLENCDEHGEEVQITLRKLLISRAAIDNGDFPQAYAAINRAAGLQPLSMLRAVAFHNRATLMKSYSDICDEATALLSKGLPLAARSYADLLEGDPKPIVGFEKELRDRLGAPQSLSGTALLEAYFKRLKTSHGPVPIQILYDFFRDLVSAYNAFIACAAEARIANCPQRDAFARHVLLGELLHPGPGTHSVYRHYYHGPAAKSGQSGLLAKLRLLHKKMQLMILSYSPSRTQSAEASEIKILPQRAIASSGNVVPYYYDPDHRGGLLKQLWDPEAVARQHADTTVRCYDEVDMGADTDRNPARRNIDDQSLFRVEGPLGKPDAEQVKKRVEALRDNLRLAFDVVEVTLAPKDDADAVERLCNYADLEYRFQDLRLALLRKLRLIAVFLRKLEAGATGWLTYVDAQLESASSLLKLLDGMIAELADARVDSLDGKALERRYLKLLDQAARYRAELGGFVQVVASQALLTPGDVRASAKSCSPYYGLLALAICEIKLQLAYLFEQVDLGALLALVHRVAVQRRELLRNHPYVFKNFIAEHPAIEHVAGTSKGGTYILLSDQGSVIADFYLPYLCCCEPCPAHQVDHIRPIVPVYLEVICDERIVLARGSSLRGQGAGGEKPPVAISPVAPGARRRGEKWVVLPETGKPVEIPEVGGAFAIEFDEDLKTDLLVFYRGKGLKDERLTFALSVGKDPSSAERYIFWVTLQVPPLMACDDVAVTVIGKPVTIRLLANDLLPTVDYSVVVHRDPRRGKVSKVAEDGTVDYMPFGEEAGVDAFDYRITAKWPGCGNVTSTARITVHITDYRKETDAPPEAPPKDPEIRLPHERFCRHLGGEFAIQTIGDVTNIRGPGVVPIIRARDKLGVYAASHFRPIAGGLTLGNMFNRRPGTGAVTGPALGVEDPGLAELRARLEPGTTVRVLPDRRLPFGAIRIAGRNVPLETTGLTDSVLASVSRRLSARDVLAEVEYVFKPAQVEPGDIAIKYDVPADEGGTTTEVLEVEVIAFSEEIGAKLEPLPGSKRVAVTFTYEPPAGLDGLHWRWDYGDGSELSDKPAHIYDLEMLSWGKPVEVVLTIWPKDADLKHCIHEVRRLLYLWPVDKTPVETAIEETNEKWIEKLKDPTVVTITDEKDRHDLDAIKAFLGTVGLLLAGDKGTEDYRDGKLDAVIEGHNERATREMTAVIKKSAARHGSSEVAPLVEIMVDEAAVETVHITAKQPGKEAEEIPAETETMLNNWMSAIAELKGADVPVNEGDKMARVFVDASERVENDKLKARLMEVATKAREL